MFDRQPGSPLFENSRPHATGHQRWRPRRSLNALKDRATRAAVARRPFNQLIRAAVTAMLLALAPVLGASRADATVYTVELPSFVTGTITTDGNITTPLAATDITSWQINQTADTVHFPSGMNPGNSVLSLIPGALTATATELLFNFSDTSASKLEISSTAFPGNSLQYCDAVSACINQNGASDFSEAEYVFVAPGCCSTSNGSVETGIVAIGVAPVTQPAPEPGTFGLFGMALLGLAWLRRKPCTQLVIRSDTFNSRRRKGVSFGNSKFAALRYALAIVAGATACRSPRAS